MSNTFIFTWYSWLNNYQGETFYGSDVVLLLCLYLYWFTNFATVSLTCIIRWSEHILFCSLCLWIIVCIIFYLWFMNHLILSHHFVIKLTCEISKIFSKCKLKQWIYQFLISETVFICLMPLLPHCTSI